MNELPVRGLGPPPAAGRGRATSSATRCSWPTSTSTSCPRCFDGAWLWSARRPALAWFRRSDYLGDPDVPLADAVRELVKERTGRATRTDRFACSRTCATSASPSTPSASTTASTRRGERVMAVVARRDEHALGRAPCLCDGESIEAADHGTVDADAGAVRQAAARLAPDGHGSRLRLAPDRARRAAARAHRVDRRDGERASTRRSRSRVR